MHPPKPFTDEWCKLHPGQGQCPDGVIGADIYSNLLTVIIVLGITAYVFFWLKSKKVI